MNDREERAVDREIDQYEKEIARLRAELAHVDEAKAKCRETIRQIEADDRYQAPPALVQINAPLALIQVDLTARVRTCKAILAALDGKRLDEEVGNE